jgi:hypothetical protein
MKGKYKDHITNSCKRPPPSNWHNKPVLSTYSESLNNSRTINAEIGHLKKTIIIIIIIGLKLQSLTGTKFQQTLQAGTTTFDSFYIEIMQDPKTQFIKRLDMFGNIKWGQWMWGNKNKMGNIK